MSLVSATRSTQFLIFTSAPVLELQEKMLEYSHDSRLRTVKKTDESSAVYDDYFRTTNVHDDNWRR